MPWVNGIYSRGYASWSNDASNNLPISATKFDLEDNDFASGLNNAITKDGLSKPNAPMAWGLTNGQVLALSRGSDGTVLSIGRTNGSTNPTLSLNITDASGAAIALSTFQQLNFFVGGNQVAGFGINGGLNVLAPSAAGNALTVSGRTSSYAGYFQGATSVSGSFGVVIQAGSNVSDVAFDVVNYTNTVQYFTISGDGGLLIGAPAGGSAGPGTLNANVAIYINGAPLLTAAAASSTYVTSAQQATALAPYAQTATVAATYETIANFNATIANYYTISQINSGLATKANLASPVLTGTPSSTTPAPGTNSTQIATAAFAYGTLTAATNGSVTLPNNLILKWGQSSGAGGSPESVSFGTAFPNACFGVTCTPLSSTSSDDLAVYGFTTSGFSIFKSASGVPSQYMAIGN